MNIKELAEQAGMHSPDRFKLTVGHMAMFQLEKFAELVAAAEREAIADEYWSALLSDMEHGVKCLNIQAAKDFNRTMPELSKFGRWLNDRSDAHEEHQQVN
jgi:glutamine synthetase adenylyltransferase